MQKYLRIGSAAVIASSGFTAAATLPGPALAQQRSEEQVNTDAYTYMATQPNMASWADLVTYVGLMASLHYAKPFTIFVPVDTDVHPLETISMCSADKRFAFVKSHIVYGKHYLAEATTGKPLTALSGATITFSTSLTGLEQTRITWEEQNHWKLWDHQAGTLSGKPVDTSNALIYPVRLGYEVACGDVVCGPSCPLNPATGHCACGPVTK